MTEGHPKQTPPPIETIAPPLPPVENGDVVPPPTPPEDHEASRFQPVVDRARLAAQGLARATRAARHHTRVGYHRLQANVGEADRDRAGETMERMDHKAGLYQYIGETIVHGSSDVSGQAESIAATKRAGITLGRGNDLDAAPTPRTAPERRKQKMMEKHMEELLEGRKPERKAKKHFSNEVDKWRTDQTYGPRDELTDSKVTRFVDKQKINIQRSGGNLSFRAANDAKQAIDAETLPFGLKEHKRYDGRLRRSSRKMDKLERQRENERRKLVADQGILGSWRDRKQQRAVKTIISGQHRSVKHREKIEELQRQYRNPEAENIEPRTDTRADDDTGPIVMPPNFWQTNPTGPPNPGDDDYVVPIRSTTPPPIPPLNRGRQSGDPT